MENLAPFHVGQKVVALQGGSDDYIQKGTVYTIRAIFPFSCGCYCVDVGVLNEGITRCRCLHGVVVDYPVYRLFEPKFFAPILENFQSISLSEILEEETKLIGVN